MSNDFETMITIKFSDLQLHWKQPDYTRGRTGFCTAGAAASPKKPTSRRARTCFGRDRHPAECDCQGNPGGTGSRREAEKAP